MRIAVVGTGGIGGPYGASLAKAGADVTFVARGAHLEAMRENGLRVEGDRGETHIRPAKATDHIAGIGSVDFVLFCVKLWDVESVGKELCAMAGFEGVLSPDIRVPIWDKFILLVPLSSLNALTRLPLGKWRDDPDLLALYEASLRETVAVGLAEGVRLPPDTVGQTLAMMRSMPAYHTTSMGNDLLRGNRLELPWFAGKVVELGRSHGIPTPANTFIYTALKPYVNGPP